MKEGDVVLTPLPQSDGVVKNRPALVLRVMPPYGDYLVCGISTQLQRAVPRFDDVLARADSDFRATGLVAESVIRLGFLAVLPSRRIVGVIGSIGRDRHACLLRRLSKYLTAEVGTEGAKGPAGHGSDPAARSGGD